MEVWTYPGNPYILAVARSRGEDLNVLCAVLMAFIAITDAQQRNGDGASISACQSLKVLLSAQDISCSCCRGASDEDEESGWAVQMCLWSLNPAVAFRSVSDSVRSVILASGTLSPLDSFATEVRVQANTSRDGGLSTQLLA